MVTLVKRTNQNKHVFFMLYAYNQIGHPFGQCKHFSQVEPFEKLCYIVMTYDAIT
jgi:hypothetical protein